MKKWIDRINGGLLGLMFLTTFYQVLVRNVLFTTAMWTEELAKFLFGLTALEGSLKDRSILIFDQTTPPFNLFGGASTNLLKMSLAALCSREAPSFFCFMKVCPPSVGE